LGDRCPNGQCEAIFDIYASRPFQWHQEHPNARCFGPFCRALNIRDSRRTPNPHFFQVLGFTPTLGQSRVATIPLSVKSTYICLMVLTRCLAVILFFCCTYDTFSYLKQVSKKIKCYNGSWFHQQPPPYTKPLSHLNTKMDIATSWITEIVRIEIRIATYYVIRLLDV